MKIKLFTFLAAVFTFSIAFSQSPQKMSYQAVVRDASNVLVQNSTVGTKISILKDSPTGIVAYAETHAPQTNDNGIINIEIGTGTTLTGSFSGIDWSTGIYWLKTEIDPDGGNTYTISATSQLLSVPYSFYADYANSSGNEIEEVTDNGDTTLTFEFANGTSYTTPVLSSFQGAQGVDGASGTPGVSIVDTYIQDDSLIVELSNGQELNAGSVNFSGQNINLCTVTTSGTSDITANTAKVGFIVPDGGGELVIAHGVCYSQASNPTVANKKQALSFPEVNTAASMQITSLIPGTTYYTRAFATNAKGTSYGNEISFTTAAPCINPGVYNGSFQYTLKQGSATVHTATVSATFTINSDFSFTLVFSDAASPLVCNTGFTIQGTVGCSNPPSNAPQLVLASGTTGGCIINSSSSNGLFYNSLNPNVSFMIGGGVGTPSGPSITSSGTTYNLTGTFTF